MSVFGLQKEIGLAMLDFRCAIADFSPRKRGPRLFLEIQNSCSSRGRFQFNGLHKEAGECRRKTENIPMIYDKTMALEFELNLYLSFI
jgi:hypothetical protein